MGGNKKIIRKSSPPCYHFYYGYIENGHNVKDRVA